MRYHARLHHALLSDLGISPEQPLTSDCSVETVRRILMARSFFKKCTDEVSDAADSVALAKFVACNDLCRDFTLSPRHLYDDEIIGGVKASFDLACFDGPDLRFDLARISEHFGLGPGANLGCESYDFYTKLFDSTLTRTNDQIYRLYRCAISDSPSWLQAEQSRSAHRGNVLVAGSKLSFVPKTLDVSRTICTEPTLNMLFQKGLGKSLEFELKRLYRIDLSVQPDLNRRLAFRGSVDGSYGTIDLSSASDSISIELCKQILPKYFFDWLMLARSPSTFLHDGREVRLDMISSMGNAFTFPLQTMIFAALVVSCYNVLGIKPKYSRKGPLNFAVFGDDIIVRKDAYNLVVRSLNLFGFSVNVDKSFNSGSFRESCGSDFFKGLDVRGTYLKGLQHETEFYSAFNRTASWSARSGVPMPCTLRLILDKIPPNRRCFVPLWAGDAEGIRTPLQVVRERPHLLSLSLLRFLASGRKRRCESSLKGDQIDGRLVSPAVRSLGVSSSRAQYRKLQRTERRARELCSLVFVYLRTIPHELRVPTDGNAEGWTRGFGYNPSGIFISLVGGFIRNGRISVRSDRRRTKVSLGTSSSWDDPNGAPERVEHDFAVMLGSLLDAD